MDELNKAVKLAFEVWRKEQSDGEPFREGDSFVAVFNNCCMYASLENGHLKTEFMGDLPVKIDMTISLYDDNLEEIPED